VRGFRNDKNKTNMSLPFKMHLIIIFLINN